MWREIFTGYITTKKFRSVIISDTCDCQTDMEEELAIEFAYVVTMFATMYIAAVREELPCEYEARNTKNML